MYRCMLLICNICFYYTLSISTMNNITQQTLLNNEILVLLLENIKIFKIFLYIFAGIYRTHIKISCVKVLKITLKVFYKKMFIFTWTFRLLWFILQQFYYNIYVVYLKNRQTYRKKEMFVYTFNYLQTLEYTICSLGMLCSLKKKHFFKDIQIWLFVKINDTIIKSTPV